MATATATMTEIRILAIEQFGGEDFLPAPSLSAVLESLIEDYHAIIGHLERVGVTVLWRAKDGKSKGRPKFGQCQKTAGLLGYFSQTEFVITVSADHCRKAEFMTAQLRALVYHEALQYPRTGRLSVSLLRSRCPSCCFACRSHPSKGSRRDQWYRESGHRL